MLKNNKKNNIAALFTVNGAVKASASCLFPTPTYAARSFFIYARV